MCRVLEVSVSGYYAWKKRLPSKRVQQNEHLEEHIRRVHQTSRETYGSPRIYRDLVAEGHACSENRVARLMKVKGIRAKTVKRFIATTDSNHDLPVAENVLDRQFTVEQENAVWASDFTYIWTKEGWLYLAVILDLFSRRVIGWSMAKTRDAELVTNALHMAITLRGVCTGLLHHSDRGSQYLSCDYLEMLGGIGARLSMSRKGDCWDNAVVESFFATLKRECIYRRSYETCDQARQDIFGYIEVFYNRKRRHSTLGYLSPVDYEQQMAQLVPRAA